MHLLFLSSKLLLLLFYNKNSIGGSITFHKSKLHIIYINLLLNSVFKDPIYYFHSMFQMSNYSKESRTIVTDVEFLKSTKKTDVR